MEDGQPGVSGAHAQWPVEMESRKDQGHALILYHNLMEMVVQEVRRTTRCVSCLTVQVVFLKYLKQYSNNMSQESGIFQ